jgi:hypothetical protein
MSAAWVAQSPGYLDPSYQTNFFLPQHAWSSLPAEGCNCKCLHSFLGLGPVYNG